MSSEPWPDEHLSGGGKKWVVAYCPPGQVVGDPKTRVYQPVQPGVQVRTHEKNESERPARRLLRLTHIVTSTIGSKHCGGCSRRSEGAEEIKMTGIVPGANDRNRPIRLSARARSVAVAAT